MQIYSKNIYEVVENKSEKNILIIYNISGNHYVGLPIHNNKIKNSIYIPSILKPNGIYWVNFGINIGSELRKLRPAILWRSSSNKEMWTVIPLSTKCLSDKYYFHYDIECLPFGTAKVESMTNLSYKRIKEPYFYNKKIAYLTEKDYKNISKAISRYYLFSNIG
ncbi:MAG: type II toxin-antitoxin system PemK/MazF family toxin [Firmicutes bacterium]|nr:type II toxin-antitoxin system PemK/MazF family toxin [Bacillota bacterium]